MSRADRRWLLLLAMGVAGPASAYTLTGWDWTWQTNPMTDPFEINVSSFPTGIGTTQQITNALRDGMGIWGTDGGARFSFNYGGTSTRTSWTSDGRLVSQYSNTTVSGGTLAVSQSWGFGDEMTDCDQRYYARNAYGSIAWSADPNGAGWNELDLERVAIHEYGHCAGLDHSGNGNAIMYASATTGTGPNQRNLHNDDKNGIQAIYGQGQAPGGSPLLLDPDGMIVAGAAHTFTISGANAGERVYLVHSTAGVGNGPCPRILNNGAICLGINAPYAVVGNAIANNQGTARITATIPTNYAGWTIGFQAAVLRGVNNRDSILSDPRGMLALPAGSSCGAGEALDCTGACWDETWVGDGYCDDGTVYQWGNANFYCDAFLDDAGDCP